MRCRLSALDRDERSLVLPDVERFENAKIRTRWRLSVLDGCGALFEDDRR